MPMKKISKQIVLTAILACCSLVSYTFLQFTYARERQSMNNREQTDKDILEYEEMEEMHIPDIRIIKQTIDLARGFWPVS